MDSLRHNFRPNKAEINTAIIHVQAGLIPLAFSPVSEELQEDNQSNTYRSSEKSKKQIYIQIFNFKMTKRKYLLKLLAYMLEYGCVFKTSLQYLPS